MRRTGQGRKGVEMEQALIGGERERADERRVSERTSRGHCTLHSSESSPRLIGGGPFSETLSLLLYSTLHPSKIMSPLHRTPVTVLSDNSGLKLPFGRERRARQDATISGQNHRISGNFAVSLASRAFLSLNALPHLAGYYDIVTHCTGYD